MAKDNALSFGGSDFVSNWKKGIGTFKFHPSDETKIKLVMEKETYKFRDKMLPDFPKKLREDFEYFVEFRVDDDGDIQSIDNIRPAKWMGLKMRVIDMTRPDPEKLEPPAPYTYTANYSGKEVEETAFYMFYDCVDPDSEFYGCRFPNRYFYKFKNDGEGMTMWDGDYNNVKATRLHRVVDHLLMLGAVSEPIEWPDDGNILPELLARILNANVVVETAGGSKYSSISEMVVSSAPPVVQDNAPIPTEEKVNPEKEDKTPFEDW